MHLHILFRSKFVKELYKNAHNCTHNMSIITYSFRTAGLGLTCQQHLVNFNGLNRESVKRTRCIMGMSLNSPSKGTKKFDYFLMHIIYYKPESSEQDTVRTSSIMLHFIKKIKKINLLAVDQPSLRRHTPFLLGGLPCVVNFK